MIFISFGLQRENDCLWSQGVPGYCEMNPVLLGVMAGGNAAFQHAVSVEEVN
jgi:hypothetical protein